MDEQKLSKGTIAILIGFAVVFDLISAGLDFVVIGFLIDPLIDFIAALFFGICFSHLGKSVFSHSPLGFLGTIVGKAVPGVEIIPFWTFFVVKHAFSDIVDAAPRPRS